MRSISTALQEHLDSGTTTVTHLLRIDPVTPGYASIGVTLLDRNVVYNDGTSEVTYLAAIGMVPATLAYTSDMDVDNTEIQHLVPEFDLPISEADIAAGVYDFAQYSVYLVNYEDLTMGHVVLSFGQLGQMRVEDGLSFWSELTALSKQLKQSLVEKDSITCRAIFGSQPLGSGGATPGSEEQRFPCGFDADSLNVSATVTSVGAEANRTFGASSLGQATDYFVPGMMQWLTGANAGRSYEVEGFTSGGAVDLTFETMFPIEAGDTFTIRPDCTTWKDGPNGCKAHFGSTDWVLHYRGEPFIPIADADQINAPGATVTGNGRIVGNSEGGGA